GSSRSPGSLPRIRPRPRARTRPTARRAIPGSRAPPTRKYERRSPRERPPPAHSMRPGRVAPRPERRTGASPHHRRAEGLGPALVVEDDQVDPGRSGLAALRAQVPDLVLRRIAAEAVDEISRDVAHLAREGILDSADAERPRPRWIRVDVDPVGDRRGSGSGRNHSGDSVHGTHPEHAPRRVPRKGPDVVIDEPLRGREYLDRPEAGNVRAREPGGGPDPDASVRVEREIVHLRAREPRPALGRSDRQEASEGAALDAARAQRRADPGGGRI